MKQMGIVDEILEDSVWEEWGTKAEEIMKDMGQAPESV